MAGFINFGAGLAGLGKAVGQFSAQAMAEQMRIQAERDSMLLADHLARTRQQEQRQWELSPEVTAAKASQTAAVETARGTAASDLPVSKTKQAELDAQERYRQTEQENTKAYRDATLAQGKERIDIARQTAGNFGRGMEGRAYNLLAAGLKDPSVRATAEYATAWQILSNPKVDPATGTVIVPDLSNFLPPTGKQGAQDGASSSGTQRMPSIQSFAPPNPSQAEASSAGFANRLDEANKILENPDVSKAGMALSERVKSRVPVAGNFLVSPEFQKYDQAVRNFINAQLRRESGAVISDEEFANARQQYFPQPGDSADVLKQKKSNRDMAVRNMQLSAGNTLLPPGVIQQASPAKGSPIVPMSQGFSPSTDAPSKTVRFEDLP